MSDPVGEFGGGTARQRMKDARLLERALRERWPIPTALRGPLIDRLAAIAQSPDASPREAVAAARAIFQASRINLESITATMKVREHEELAERVAELERRSSDGGASSWGG